MKFMRTIWFLAIVAAFWQLLIFATVALFIWCVSCAKERLATFKDGVKAWWGYIKNACKMTKHIIINGIDLF